MSATTVTREKTLGALTVRIADARDDEGIRLLLAENPMGRAVQLSFEREPNYFAGEQLLSDRAVTIVTVENDTGRIVAIGSRNVRRAFINGKEKLLGYLSGLRIDRRWRGRIRMLIDGYSMLNQSRVHDECNFDFTAIVSDNQPARRLLEAQVRGLPHYRPWSDYTTAIWKASRRSARKHGIEVRRGLGDDAASAARLLAKSGARFHCSPSWNEAELIALQSGAAPIDYSLGFRGGRLVGIVGLWRQNSFRQTVIRGYGQPLKFARPAVNLLSRFSHLPHLPVPGTRLELGYLSHVAVVDDDPAIFLTLLSEASRMFSQINLVAGFYPSHPLAQVIRRRFRPWTYRSRIYLVEWIDSAHVALDARPVCPEVAFL